MLITWRDPFEPKGPLKCTPNFFFVAVMSFLAPLTGSLPQCERSEVKGNRSKPEHEWLNPAVAPD